MEDHPKTESRSWPYLWLVLGVAAVGTVSNLAGDAILAQLSSLGDAPTAPVLASLALIAICGFHRLIPGSRGLSFGELLFIAFVRETGAIPACCWSPPLPA